jgi:hypothetical protein
MSALMIFWGCGCQVINSSSDCVEINIERNIKNINKLNICDYNGELCYVPLMSTLVPFKTIMLVDFTDKFILVSDRLNCYLYNINGSFISTIGNRGKGPGEYAMVYNVKFGYQNQIFIQDGKSFLQFDMAGTFLRKFSLKVQEDNGPIPGIISSWALFNDSVFIGQISNNTGKEKYKAALFDNNGKGIKYMDNHIIYSKVQVSLSTENSDASIYPFDGQIHFKEYVNDTLFSVNKLYEFNPIYYFNLGKFGMPSKFRGLPMDEMSEKRKEYIGIMKIHETSKYLFLACNFRNHTPSKRAEPKPVVIYGQLAYSYYYTDDILGIYEKKSRNLIFAETIKSEENMRNCGLFNDYDGGPNFFPRTQVNDSTLAMWIDAFRLKEHVASEAFKNSTPKYPEKKKELEKLANCLSDNDNPVLILCTFKK